MDRSPGPTDQDKRKTIGAGMGAGPYTEQKKIFFFIFSHDIHPRATPGEGRTRNRCRPSGKTDQGNRSARVVNDGGGWIRSRKDPGSPIFYRQTRTKPGPDCMNIIQKRS